GQLEAVHAAEASSILADRGLFPLGVDETSAARTRSAPRRDLAIVFRSLASLVDAGVPIEKALLASEQVARGRLRAVLSVARTALREGKSLGAALDSARGVIPGIAVGMIRAGERGSRLGQALAEVAGHLEMEAELTSRLRQALAYPMLLLVAGTATVLVIGTVVIPKFADLLSDMGQQLPATTRVLLATSTFLTGHWLAVLLSTLTVVGVVAQWIATAAGRLRSDRWLAGLPVIGGIRLGLASARTCRAMGGLLRSGVPLLMALDAARDACGSPAIALRLARARERVAEGATLTSALTQENAVTGSALQLIAVGEAGGELGAMATRAGDLAAREADRALRTAVSLLEPALIVLFGGLVAFVAAALLQAVYGMRVG
ncbi:MAG: type II secretion system F family protein, partial [Gemmatimonadales bacterium]